jgi:GTP cyclohydrolase II
MCAGSVCCALGRNSALGRALGTWRTHRCSCRQSEGSPCIYSATQLTFVIRRRRSRSVWCAFCGHLVSSCRGRSYARGRERPWASVQSGVRGLNGLHAVQHDECNGSDVFGSDICTCRPYLAHGIEGCVKAAQNGGVGLIVYCRKEARSDASHCHAVCELLERLIDVMRRGVRLAR